MKRKYLKGARLVYTIYHYPDLEGNRATFTACERGTTDAIASLVVTWDETCAYAGELMASGVHFAAAHHLIGCAAEFIRDFLKLPGVLIHTQGVNTTRRFYWRLGFRAVPEIPGLMAARTEDICAPFAHLSKRPAEKEKPLE